MRPSRRFHLVLSDALHSELRSFATRHGLSLAEALRALASRSLTAATTGSGIQVENPATLATLVAAEHAALMVAAVLPDGRRLMQRLASEAAAAAEERLAIFRESER